MSHPVELALKYSVGRLKGLLSNDDFPDNERHNTAVALHIVANGSKSKVFGRSAINALNKARSRFQEVLANDQLPHEERLLTEVILGEVLTALGSISKRELPNQKAARNYVIDSLIATLENDLDGTGANYLYENLSNDDSEMAVAAARKLVKELGAMKASL